MLQWTEQFATGYAEIDAQHQTLIDYINRLQGHILRIDLQLKPCLERTPAD